MRFVCYLGTRGCPGVLAEAFREGFEPVTIAVPVEPRLLGPRLDADRLEAGLQAVAETLAKRAQALAHERARRAEDELAGVFGQEADPSERIRTQLVEPPIEDQLPRRAEEAGAEACLLARDALDILDEAGVGLVDALEDGNVELVTR